MECPICKDSIMGPGKVLAEFGWELCPGCEGTTEVPDDFLLEDEEDDEED